MTPVVLQLSSALTSSPCYGNWTVVFCHSSHCYIYSRFRIAAPHLSGDHPLLVASDSFSSCDITVRACFMSEPSSRQEFTQLSPLCYCSPPILCPNRLRVALPTPCRSQHSECGPSQRDRTESIPCYFLGHKVFLGISGCQQCSRWFQS